MAYKLTPEQYREAARRRVSNQNTAENTNSAVSAYARAIDPSRGIDNKAQQTAEDTAAVSKEKNSGTDNWILQLGATVLGDVVIRPLEGTAKFVENSLLDFTAGIVATGLDWVGADDAAESVQDFAAIDFVGDAFDWAPIQAIYDSSFSNEWGKFGDILQQATYSVGEQAIPFALNFVPGVGPIISQIAFAQGAYGGSFESASQDGASVQGANAYATMSAALEWGIERLTSGVVDAKWGKGAMDGLEKVISKVAKGKTAQKIFSKAFDMFGEGAEEVISGFLENYVQAMTYKADTSSFEAYVNNILTTDPATAEELLEQFLVGAAASGFMGGAVDTIRHNSPSMQFSETSQELQELHDKAYRLNEKGKDTSAVEAEIAEKDAELAGIANKYKYRLQDGYQKGKKGYGSIIAYMDNYYEKDSDGNYGASKGALIHHQNVGYGARQADVDAALSGRAVIHQGALTGKSAEARTAVDKAVKNLNKSLKGQRLSVVYADINQTAGATDYGYIDKANRVIVLDARYLGTQVDFKASDGNVYKVEAGMSTLLHEVFHDVENTKAGDKLKKTLAEYARNHSETKLNLSSKSENNLTNEGETQYSRRTTKYISDKTIGEDNLRVINHKLSALYADVTDGIADGIAIENGDTIYIVDSGKDNGKLDFGVRKRKTIQDAKLRAEAVRRINNDAISKGHISDGLSSRLGNGYDNDSGRNLRREPGNELSTDTRESANNEKGISGEVRDSRRVTGDEGVTDLVAEVKKSYPEANAETLQSELAARQLENLLLNERVINALTQDNSTLAKRILRGAERLLAALKGENLAETKDLERILNKTIKLYNKAIAQKGKGQTVKVKSKRKEDETASGSQYSIRVIDGKEIVVIDTDQDIFDGKEKSDYPKIIRKYMLEKFKNKVVDIGDSKAYIARQSIEEYSYPANARGDKDVKAAKMKAGTELDNLLKTAEYLEHQEDDGRHSDAVRGWDKYKTQFIVDGRTFEGEISLKLTQRGDVFYDMTKIKDITPGMSRSILPTSSQSDAIEGNPSTNSIREENEKVNTFEKNSSGNISNDNISHSRRVTHTPSEIKAATEDMVEMLTVAGNINEDLFDVSTRKNYDLKRITADINNLAAQGKLTENSKPVKQLVEAIIDGTVLTEHYAGDLREQAVLLDTLRPFLHSMNFQEEGIKAELQHKYGKENNVFRLWGKKDGGSSWDSVVQEITEIMPILKKDSDLGTLFNIIDSYTQAVADMKRVRYEATSKIENISEVKSLMAKQLIVSLSEQGTELVTKVTADKLSEILKTERKEMQKALRAIKNGDKTVSIGDLELPQSARNQLEELSQSIAKERAAVISDKVATALVNDMRGDLTATELADLKKNVGYQLISAYVTDRYLAEGKAPSMESVRKDAAALFEALRRDVSDVKRVRDALAHNEKIVKRIRDAGYDGLKNQIRNMTVEDAYIEALDGFLAAFNQLSNADGNMRSFNEIIKKGLLKETITAFEKYFQADNPVLADMVSSGEFENIKTAVSDFKAYVDSLKTFKELSFAEREDCLNGFSVFLGAVTRAFSPETMVTINGKTVSARKYASKAIRTLEASQKRKKNGEKIDPSRGIAAHFQKYLYHIVRPNVMIGVIENSQYSDYRELGGLTGAYEDIRSGAIMGENKRLDLETIITDFWNDKKNKVGHKTYFKNLRDAMVTVQHSKGAVEMSKGEAIGLYLTLRQSDGFRHADADNASAKGIYFDLKGSIVNYAYGGEALKFTTQNVVDLESSLTEKDKQFIKVIERFMKEAAEAKGEIDRYLVGEPRLLGDDYYPLLTDETGKDRKIADKVQYYNPMDVVGHLSINQSRMNGVKALRVRNVIDTLTAYAESIGMYYGVAIPIENFRKIYNGKASNGQSLKDYIDQNISSQFKTDIEKLLLDIQGAQDIPDGFWEKRRSRFAAFQILFNLKTPFKQMSGILTLAAGLKNTSVAYGVTQTAKVFKGGQAKFDLAEMYKYCPATRVRYADHHATLAYANMENITKAMQIGGMGIELVDKWTVWIAWEACKKEVGAVGNNKNNVHLLEKAGKRLNQTLDYIDRFEITERIEFSRSPSIIKRSFAMFGSSAQAMLSQFVKHTFALSQRYYEKKHLPEMIADAKSDLQKAETRLNKAQSVYEDAKSSGDKKAIRKAAFELNQAQEEVSDCKALVGELENRQKNIESEIKRESLYTKKTIAAVTASLVAAALISQALENLLGDDEEEEENFLMSVFDETLSSIFGMFPGLGQMYNALEFDLGFYEKKSYDVSFWVIDEWQMFADAINGVIGLVDGSGTKTPARVVRDWLYALGQWYGVPFRNMYNAVNGFLNVSPTLDYKFNNLFGKGNYASDLQKAVKAGDSELAETIVGLMLKDDGGAPDTKIVRTIRSLYEQGYTGVIPRTVSSSVAIDGETYDMTTKQQKRFKQLYSQADEKIERLIGKQSFVNLSPKVQADSIKWIYDYYYQLAKYDLAGIEDDSKKALFGAHIDVETLAVAYSYCSSLETDTDKKGKAIAGSRKQKVVKYLNSLKLSAAEKYMILGYLGYSPVNQNAKTLITSYAKRNGADNNEVKAILAACNIAA